MEFHGGLLVKTGELGLDVEAGTLLCDVGEITVAYNLGIGIVTAEVFEEEPQGGNLLGGAGVGGLAFLIQASLVADSQGVLVVVAHMSSGQFLATALVDGALAVDVPVVANLGKTSRLVPAVDVVDGDVLRESRGGAVYDDVQHVFHG